MSDEPERDVEDMEERSERLKEKIEDTREDWERKQADEHVPGASQDDDEDSDADE
jgi:hypothetical protein